MTYVSNDPAWWPQINWSVIFNYFTVATATAVIYDWVLTFAHEFELIWNHRWSLMTLLYIAVRYIGILFAVVNILTYCQVSIADKVGVSDILDWVSQYNDCNSCVILWYTLTWMPVVVNAMLGVIIMTRIRAMYGRSKVLLIFLIVALLACTIASGAMAVVGNIGILAEELVFSGHYSCGLGLDPNAYYINATIVPTTVWEILVLCLAVWIVIKHFRELRRSTTGWTMEDCYMVLAQSHVLYFLAFAIGACFSIGIMSPKIMWSYSPGDAFYYGIYQFVQALQMFVLGPRLILSLREYHHAMLVARSDERTGVSTVAFQARGNASTGASDV